jgi:hypothetical protein
MECKPFKIQSEKAKLLFPSSSCPIFNHYIILKDIEIMANA